jgi:hypothetical protein
LICVKIAGQSLILIIPTHASMLHTFIYVAEIALVVTIVVPTPDPENCQVHQLTPASHEEDEGQKMAAMALNKWKATVAGSASTTPAYALVVVTAALALVVVYLAQYGNEATTVIGQRLGGGNPRRRR